MARFSPDMPLKLAQSAFTLFSREGIRNVNLEAVAGHAGVTKGSLYWHFKSKQELIQAACAHYYRTYHRRLHKEMARFTDPMARLKNAIRLSVRTCLMDRENRIFTLEIFTLSLYDEETRRSWLQFYDSVRATYVGLLEAARAAGQLKLEDPEEAANRLLEAMEGVKLRALFEPHICSEPEAERVIEGLMHILGTPVGNDRVG
jgi:AcrR family transcriptional regulator